jgi:diphthamide synthase (EF-2-diphthine--ammonia ligase)
MKLHEDACARGDFTYLDPDTGFVVFTRLGLLDRGRCCGAACRHCPFGHESVRLEARSQRIQQAAWLTDARPDADAPCSVLFWSGGKDSYLAYRALRREGVENIVLLTTFDARSRIIAHQEFAITEVVEQALHLNAPLIGVPLHPGGEYLDHIAPALDLVPNAEQLCFGDLHLEHIRDWRVEAFGGDERTSEMKLSFPLWQVPYKDLLADFEASGANSTISAITADLPGIAVGDRFNRALVARLPEGIDPFGENGEFHTRLIFPPD